MYMSELDISNVVRRLKPRIKFIQTCIVILSGTSGTQINPFPPRPAETSPFIILLSNARRF